MAGLEKFNIPFIKPDFPDPNLIAEDIRAIVKSNWFTNFGPFEREFRSRIEEYVGSGTCATTVTNATLGLDIAVCALFLGRPSRHEVIIPSFTFAAGPEVLIKNGLVPVFVDIDPTSLQPSFHQARRYIQEDPLKVAGILLCNTFGVGNSEVDEWEALAKEYEVPLVIDSAAGFGSKYPDGNRIGARGDCEVFSFHATKPFSIGEGGAVVCRDKDLQHRLMQVENFGFAGDNTVHAIGTNAKMQEICCAIGLRQFTDFDSRLLNRQASLANYKKGLLALGFTFQANDDLSSVPYASAIAPSARWAGNAIDALGREGVGVRKYYTPLHLQTEIKSRSLAAGDLSVTEDVFSRILALPLHDDMSTETINSVIEIISNCRVE